MKRMIKKGKGIEVIKNDGTVVNLKISRLQYGLRVSYMENGKLNDAKSYYTDDLEDAKDTMEAIHAELLHMENQLDENVVADPIDIEVNSKETKKLVDVANMLIGEYNHGMAEYEDCGGVTPEQYRAVIEDFLLYHDGVVIK